MPFFGKVWVKLAYHAVDSGTDRYLEELRDFLKLQFGGKRKRERQTYKKERQIEERQNFKLLEKGRQKQEREHFNLTKKNGKIKDGKIAI